MAKIYAYQVVGEGLVLLTPVGGAEHPDNSLPGGGGDHIWGGGKPGGGGAAHPDHGLPGGGGAGIPDNSLPSVRPPTLLPGWTLVLVRRPDGQWKYAALAPSSPPPRPLPEPIPPGGAPDQGLPPEAGQLPSGGGPAPSQPIAGAPTPTPKVS
jgi:hypothetical protein